MKNRLCFAFLAGLALSTAPLSAHEFWIEPERYQVQNGETFTAQFRNGEYFDGINQGYFPNRSERFEEALAGARRQVTPRMGDIPAYSGTPDRDGLLILVHETRPSSLVYKDWQKFMDFAEHKDFPDIAARHAARGLPRQGFRESYTRHAKALIAVGDGAGTDMRFGMATEFVALENPYAGPGDTLRVQLFDGDTSRADAQVEIFDRAPDGSVAVSTVRSDGDGIAEVPVQPGHSYLLDAVILREASGEDAAVWRTLWAALTFAVP